MSGASGNSNYSPPPVAPGQAPRHERSGTFNVAPSFKLGTKAWNGETLNTLFLTACKLKGMYKIDEFPNKKEAEYRGMLERRQKRLHRASYNAGTPIIIPVTVAHLYEALQSRFCTSAADESTKLRLRNIAFAMWTQDRATLKGRNYQHVVPIPATQRDRLERLLKRLAPPLPAGAGRTKLSGFDKPNYANRAGDASSGSMTSGMTDSRAAKWSQCGFPPYKRFRYRLIFGSEMTKLGYVSDTSAKPFFYKAKRPGLWEVPVRSGTTEKNRSLIPHKLYKGAPGPRNTRRQPTVPQRILAAKQSRSGPNSGTYWSTAPPPPSPPPPPPPPPLPFDHEGAAALLAQQAAEAYAAAPPGERERALALMRGPNGPNNAPRNSGRRGRMLGEISEANFDAIVANFEAAQARGSGSRQPSRQPSRRPSRAATPARSSRRPSPSSSGRSKKSGSGGSGAAMNKALEEEFANMNLRARRNRDRNLANEWFAPPR
jgi:hypothetical protein